MVIRSVTNMHLTHEDHMLVIAKNAMIVSRHKDPCAQVCARLCVRVILGFAYGFYSFVMHPYSFMFGWLVVLSLKAILDSISFYIRGRKKEEKR